MGTPRLAGCPEPAHVLLAKSGIGAEIATQAIEAYRAGDPSALAAGGNTRRFDDGRTLIHEPGKPPVVYQGLAMSGELAALPPAALADTPPAGHLMEQAWAMVGLQHRSQPGIPGIHYRTAPR